MIKKEIRICDICKTTIGTKKCELCGNDVCDDCFSDNDIEFLEISLNNILLCTECERKVQNIRGRRTKLDKNNEIKKFMIGYIKKMLIIKSLETKKNEQ